MKILIVDDEKNIRLSLAEFLVHHGFSVSSVADAASAMRKLESERFDVMLTDYRMPVKDGYELAREAMETHPNLTVVIMTAYGSIQDAVESIKRGIHDYVSKPIDTDKLLSKLRAIESSLRTGPDDRSVAVFPSDHAKTLESFSQRAAASENTVLITGETGTGKTELARAIHQRSRRSEKPFVYVNCASLSAHLVESEIFGHVKGAFTGADRARVGKIVSANGGTLFLDEIGSTSVEFQAKLLSVLQDKTVEAVGSDRRVSVDVRFIAATNADLDESIRSGKFRQDLYYRLKVLSIRMPKLSERIEDLPALVGVFMEQAKRATVRVTPAAWTRLSAYAWPGNIRELRNVVVSTLDILEGDVLDEADLAMPDGPLGAPGLPSGDSLGTKISVAERDAIQRALTSSKGNVAAAAAKLGIHERSLRRKLREHRIDRKNFKPDPV